MCPLLPPPHRKQGKYTINYLIYQKYIWISVVLYYLCPRKSLPAQGPLNNRVCPGS